MYETSFHRYTNKDLEIHESKETASSVSFLDIYLKSDINGWFLSDSGKRDDFNFTKINFPQLDCKIPIAPRIEFYISQLVNTLEFAVCIQIFYNVTVFWVLNYEVKDF